MYDLKCQNVNKLQLCYNFLALDLNFLIITIIILTPKYSRLSICNVLFSCWAPPSGNSLGLKLKGLVYLFNQLDKIWLRLESLLLASFELFTYMWSQLGGDLWTQIMTPGATVRAKNYSNRCINDLFIC